MTLATVIPLYSPVNDTTDDTDKEFPGAAKRQSMVWAPTNIQRALVQRDAELPGMQALPLEHPPGQAENNRAQQLAHREGFFEMCETSLWGSEDRQEFGEMLRGVVESFLPKTRWDLFRLTAVADLQWKVMRLQRIQKNLFEAGSSKAGQNGVPRRTEVAFEQEPQLEAARERLRREIESYYKAQRALSR